MLISGYISAATHYIHPINSKHGYTGKKRTSRAIKTTEKGNYNKYRDEGLKAEVQGYSLYIDKSARVLTSAGDLFTSTRILATRLDDGANN